MTTNTLVIIAGAIALLTIIWTKVTSWFGAKKSAKLTEEIRVLKEVSNEQVAKAAVDVKSFRERLRLYRQTRPK